MFEYIKGKLVEISAEKAVIETNGIAYKLLVPLNLHTKMATGEVTVYTSFVVREDSQTLFGFSSKEERNLFETLLNISGIGPKTALSIISHIDLDNFSSIIASADISLLSKIPGIGKKTAERLIMELKDKSLPISSNPVNQSVSDALHALIKLGYHPSKAQKALHAVLKETPALNDVSRLISSALRKV